MAALGIGEVGMDEAGEGDGCDRCGCPDEEVCCPSFWNDRGVPPCFPLSWVFDPRNRWLNNNSYARSFGSVGFPWFDKERKAIMGTALAFTVVAILVTGFGCFALSGDAATLHATAWGVSYYRAFETSKSNTTITLNPGTIAYIGLRRFVVRQCVETQGDYDSWSHCSENAIWWEHAGCKSGEKGYYGVTCHQAEECREAAMNNIFGAFMTCATLIFALIGCLTRTFLMRLFKFSTQQLVRKVADTNFQKMIGCIPDTIGVVTQFQSLANFAGGCYARMPEHGTDGQRMHYMVGFGFLAYSFCLFCAIIRVTCHYCTPVPGGGTGWQCCERLTGLDLDGDGVIGGRVEEREKNVQDAKENAFKHHRRFTSFLLEETEVTLSKKKEKKQSRHDQQQEDIFAFEDAVKENSLEMTDGLVRKAQVEHGNGSQFSFANPSHQQDTIIKTKGGSGQV